MAEPETRPERTRPVLAPVAVRRLRRPLWRPPPDARPAGREAPVDIGPRRGRRVGRVLGGGDAGRQEASTSRRPARWNPTADQLDLIASLLDAGLPLVDALDTLEVMAVDAGARSAFAHLQARVRAGGELGFVLTELAVPAHVRMLVDGGERSGRLTEAFRGAARLAARLETLRREIRRALVYPGVVLAIGLTILTVIAVAVVPPLERTFADLGGELPAITRFVLAASRPFSNPLSLATLAAVAGAVVVLRRRATPVGRRRPGHGLAPVAKVSARLGPIVESARDHLPLTGGLRRDLRLTVVAHVVASLVRGGIPLDEALARAAESLPAGRAREVLVAASERTRQGRSPFDDDVLGGLLGPAEREILRVGERNGLMAEQWVRVAQRRDRALEERMRRIGVVVEPVLVALVGGVVGGAVLALYLPTFRVMELL